MGQSFGFFNFLSTIVDKPVPQITSDSIFLPSIFGFIYQQTIYRSLYSVTNKES